MARGAREGAREASGGSTGSLRSMGKLEEHEKPEKVNDKPIQVKKSGLLAYQIQILVRNFDREILFAF
jgi:hypothetical protein